MKTLFSFLFLVAGVSAQAQVSNLDAQINQSLARINDMVVRAQGLNYVGEQAKAGVLQNLNQAIQLLQPTPPPPPVGPVYGSPVGHGNGPGTQPGYPGQQGPGYPGQQYPGQNGPGYPGQQGPGNSFPGQYGAAPNVVVAYADDNCTNALTPITARDNCSVLNSVFGNRSVWSVAVNGVCYNTADRDFVSSCQPLQNLARDAAPAVSPVVELFTDDTCGRKLVGLSQGMNFDAWSAVLGNSQVWSVRLEGQCLNIPDTFYSAQLANQYLNSALTMRGPGPRNPDQLFELFTDDTCGRPLTVVSRGDNCSAMNTFFNNSQVWSIRFRGTCQNISDTFFNQACATYSR